MKISMIAAMTEERVIGIKNTLPWKLPNDMKWFRQNTMGKPIVMGRRTFESIGRPLPGRTNIVISRNPRYPADGVSLVASLDEALALGRKIAAEDGASEIAVIGGAEIYALALPRADRLYLTRVHASLEGNALLPPVDWLQWREISRDHHSASGDNPYDYSFLVFDRAGSRD